MIETEQIADRLQKLPPPLQREVLDFIDFLAQKVVHLEAAFDALDRDTGEVTDALPQSGHRVEERGLAGVRVADDGNAQRLGRGEPLRPGSRGHVSAADVPAAAP